MPFNYLKIAEIGAQLDSQGRYEEADVAYINAFKYMQKLAQKVETQGGLSAAAIKNNNIFETQGGLSAAIDDAVKNNDISRAVTLLQQYVSSPKAEGEGSWGGISHDTALEWAAKTYIKKIFPKAKQLSNIPQYKNLMTQIQPQLQDIVDRINAATQAGDKNFGNSALYQATDAPQTPADTQSPATTQTPADTTGQAPAATTADTTGQAPGGQSSTPDTMLEQRKKANQFKNNIPLFQQYVTYANQKGWILNQLYDYAKTSQNKNFANNLAAVLEAMGIKPTDKIGKINLTPPAPPAPVPQASATDTAPKSTETSPDYYYSTFLG